jgi:outer membrane immunogenic protein
MRRLSLFFLLLIFALTTASAQSPLGRGDKQLNAGFGFSDLGTPIYAGMDFGIYQNVTAGFEGSFRSYNQHVSNNNYRINILGFSGNGNYHFSSLLEIPSEWDIYAGLNLGFYHWSTPSGYTGSGSSGLKLGIQIGGRYFFSRNFGINLELGGSNAMSSGKLGITYLF